VNLGEGRLGARGVGNGGEEECGDEGRASHPFIGPEGGAGWPEGRGIGRRWSAPLMTFTPLVFGRGKEGASGE
jgi:hypothetical protein